MQISVRMAAISPNFGLVCSCDYCAILVETGSKGYPMLEIVGGIILAVIILAMSPFLLTMVLYLIPPAIGITVGALFGYYLAGGGGMLAGVLIGLCGGIWIDNWLTRE